MSPTISWWKMYRQMHSMILLACLLRLPQLTFLDILRRKMCCRSLVRNIVRSESINEGFW
jgi:hypothetical protein